MTTRTWEDTIRPAHCRDVVTEQAAALADQQRRIVVIRQELANEPWAPSPRQITTIGRLDTDPAEAWDAERIIALRQACHLTRGGFASAVGCRINAVFRWETGKAVPRRHIAALERLEAQVREGVAA